MNAVGRHTTQIDVVDGMATATSTPVLAQQIDGAQVALTAASLQRMGMLLWMPDFTLQPGAVLSDNASGDLDWVAVPETDSGSSIAAAGVLLGLGGARRRRRVSARRGFEGCPA